MSLRYRIIYDKNSKYSIKRAHPFKLKYLISGCFILLIIAVLLIPSYRTKICEKLLPGGSVVTTNALQEFSNTIDRGESLSNALDAFCETIMDAR